MLAVSFLELDGKDLRETAESKKKVASRAVNTVDQGVVGRV
jgi:hypothetical protein